MNAYFRLVRRDLFLELLRHTRHFASVVPSDLVWSYLTHTDLTRLVSYAFSRKITVSH